MKLFNRNFLFIIAGILFIHSGNSLALPDSLYVPDETYIVDSITIAGNDITEEYIILRELTFQIGDTVTTSQLLFNRERIISLRLFTKVDVIPVVINNKTIISIDLNEGWYLYPIPFIRRQNNDSELSYGINISYKNFRGRNERLRTIISLGYDPFFSLLYQNPAIDYENNLGLSFALSLLNLNNKSASAKRLYGDDFDYKFYSIGFVLGKRFDQFNDLYGGIGFTYVTAPENAIGKMTASGKSIDRVISLTAGYTYDSRDLKQHSQEGIYTLAQLQHKGLGFSNINYNIFFLDFREYRGIVENLSARWRIALRHTFGKSIPYYDYSYFGYEEYVRGYSNESSEGNNFILTSIEVSYPIIKDFDFSIKLPLIPRQITSARIGIYLSVFTDAGQVFNNHQRFHFGDFSTGYGFGLTILALPYNAIRFEYAFNKFGIGEFLIGSDFSF
jgi:outer membrane protein assembly factor BamA